jgi:hypothetical protein
MEQQNLWDTMLTFNLVTKEVKKAIAKAVQASGLSREQAMDKVNTLARAYGVTLIKGNGVEISIETWEKWLNPADETRVPGMKALTVICAAFDTMEPLRPMAELAGGRVIDKKEAKLLEWAKAYQRARKARQEMKTLEECI